MAERQQSLRRGAKAPAQDNAVLNGIAERMGACSATPAAPLRLRLPRRDACDGLLAAGPAPQPRSAVVCGAPACRLYTHLPGA